jgi:DNA/RNA-binding domain of Phe-tRNA-synthetase-like protein
MNKLNYSIAAEVFNRFSDYVRGVVLAYDVKNGESPAELIEMLRAAEASARERLNLEKLAEHPRVASRRERETTGKRIGYGYF